MMRFASYNVSIFPPLEIRKKTTRVSKKLRRSGGLFVLGRKDCYPHITFYMTEFPTKNIKAIKKILQQISSTTHSFRLKPVTYRTHEGYVDVSFQRDERIMELHGAIIRRLNRFRGGLMRPKDLTRLHQLSPPKQRNLRRYGYGNVFSQFRPHLTFTKLKSLKKKIISLPPKSEFSFLAGELALFQSAEYGTCRKIIARFKLA